MAAQGPTRTNVCDEGASHAACLCDGMYGNYLVDWSVCCRGFVSLVPAVVPAVVLIGSLTQHTWSGEELRASATVLVRTMCEYSLVAI